MPTIAAFLSRAVRYIGMTGSPRVAMILPCQRRPGFFFILLFLAFSLVSASPSSWDFASCSELCHPSLLIFSASILCDESLDGPLTITKSRLVDSSRTYNTRWVVHRHSRSHAAPSPPARGLPHPPAVIINLHLALLTARRPRSPLPHTRRRWAWRHQHQH